MGEFVKNKYGVLPRQELLDAFDCGMLSSETDPKSYMQPASVDIPLGERVIRLKSSFLPDNKIGSVEATIKKLSRDEFSLNELVPKALVRGQTYLAELDMEANLQKNYSGTLNPKSTTGRADCLTRVIVDGVRNYDTVSEGKGRKFWLEITPLSWDVKVTKGLALNQLRLSYGENPLDEGALVMAYMKTPLLIDPEGQTIPIEKACFKRGGLEMTVDLDADIVGYKAKRNSLLEFNLSAEKGTLAEQQNKFFEPIERPKDGELVLEPDTFYLLGTREKAVIPEGLCGTLRAYDPASAEGRVHYAGFFDPGFCAHATLEVRLNHLPFLIKDGQPICVLQYERMKDIPRDENGEPKLYVGNYQDQPRGPNLPKQFGVRKVEAGSLR